MGGEPSQEVPAAPGPRTARKAKRKTAGELGAAPPAGGVPPNGASAQGGKGPAQAARGHPKGSVQAALGLTVAAGDKYEYTPLVQLFNEARSQTKKRFNAWAVVLRVGRVRPTTGADVYTTVEVADETLHPGHRTNDMAASLVLFAEPAAGRRLASLVLCPGDLVRLHRVSVKVWEGRLQLSGNVSKRLGGGVTAVLSLHPLGSRPDQAFDQAPAGGGSGSGSSSSSGGGSSSSSGGGSSSSSSSSIGDGGDGDGRVSTKRARLSAEAAGDADGGAGGSDGEGGFGLGRPLAESHPYVLHSEPLLVAAGLDLARRVQAVQPAAGPDGQWEEDGDEEPEVEEFLLTKSSQGATAPDLAGARVKKLSRFAFRCSAPRGPFSTSNAAALSPGPGGQTVSWPFFFVLNFILLGLALGLAASLLSAACRPPLLGAAAERWARLAEVPRLMEHGNAWGGGAAGEGFTPFDRMKVYRQRAGAFLGGWGFGGLGLWGLGLWGVLGLWGGWGFSGGWGAGGLRVLTSIRRLINLVS